MHGRPGQPHRLVHAGLLNKPPGVSYVRMETGGMAHWRDLFYEVSDGLRLYARDYPGPSPDAPVALLMHGLTRNSADFEALSPVLAKTHRVLVVDQRGRGRSDRDPDASRYHLATYVGDMFELLAQQAITQVAVVGTSMGGLMAMVMKRQESQHLQPCCHQRHWPSGGARGTCPHQELCGYRFSVLNLGGGCSSHQSPQRSCVSSLHP